MTNEPAGKYRQTEASGTIFLELTRLAAVSQRYPVTERSKTGGDDVFDVSIVEEVIVFIEKMAP